MVRQSITIGGREFRLGERPHIVGVVNLSPESPNQDAVVVGGEGAVERARRLAVEGASIMDIGGQSSNFAAPMVSVEEETSRLLPAIRDLKAAGFLVSVDSWDAGVLRAAAEAGADVINDSDGFQDPAVIDAIAESGLPVIIPFLNGPNPREVQPFDYERPMEVMLPWFEAALRRADAAGVRDIIVDPGTGYAQRHLSTEAKEAYQRRVYPNLQRIRELGHPLFVALPRKADPEVTFELACTLAEVADFLRAHDAALATRAIAAAGRF
jgi:dihydropteroate synthase